MAKKLPTDKTVKGIFEDYDQFLTDDYIWNKKLEDYTKEDIAKMKDDSIDLAYDHGIAFLEYIHATIKTHQTRISLLLGYLLLLVTSLMGFIFEDKMLEGTFEWLSLILAGVYFVLMVLLFDLLTGQQIASTYFTPREFLHKDRYKFDKKLLKLYTCKTLQVSAEKNLAILRKFSLFSKIYLLLFASVSTIAIIVAVYTSFTPPIPA